MYLNPVKRQNHVYRHNTVFALRLKLKTIATAVEGVFFSRSASWTLRSGVLAAALPS